MSSDTDLPKLIKNLSESTSCNATTISNTTVQISLGISEEKYTLTDVVGELKELLTDSTPEIRSKGVMILSCILEKLDSKVLTSNNLPFICDFYKSKLSDHHEVIPAALKGILALVKLKELSDDAALQFVQAIFSNISCQQQQQPDRNTLFKIIIFLLERHESALKSMGLDFVYGVMSAIDGERDPRNLLLLFNWLPKFLKSVELEHLTEEMFEIMACYFPVDFRAPSQDPNAIERDTLAESLMYCLCALPAFAEHCIPLAMEKLDSSLETAKYDSLDLLKESCQTFKVEDYQTYSKDVLYLIQKQLFNCTDDQLESKSLETLTAIINKLSQGDENDFKQQLKNITDSLKGNLLPDGKLFKIASKIFLHIAKASKSSALIIAKDIIPLLVNTFHITNTSAQKATILKALTYFVPVYSESVVEDVEIIPTLCLQSLIHGDELLRQIAAESLAFVSEFLNPLTRKCLYEALSDMLLSESSIKVRTALLRLLKVLCTHYSAEVNENLILKMSVTDKKLLKAYLETLTCVATVKSCFVFVLPVFKRYCFGDLSEAELAYFYLRQIFIDEGNERNGHLNETEVVEIVDDIISWNAKNLELIDVRQKQEFLDNEGYVVMQLIGRLNPEIQAVKVQIWSSDILEKFNTNSNAVLLVLLNGLFLRLHPTVKITQSAIYQIINITLSSDIEYIQTIMAQLAANILNKMDNDLAVSAVINNLKEICDNTLTNNSESPKNIIILISWVIKALAMKNDTHANFWIDKLFDLLESHKEAAYAFKILMTDKCTALSAQCFCNTRLLYRQKLFAYVLTKLNEKYKPGANTLIVAFGYLLQETPVQILCMYFKEALKYLMLCLSFCEVPEVLQNVLLKVNTTLETSKETMEPYAEQFLPRLLKLAKFQPSMQVRIAALKCIQLFTTASPIYSLLPMKNEVIKELSDCLDDPKRLVRKEAVEARSSWFLLDATV